MRDAHGGFDSSRRSVTSRENRAVNREPRAAATLLRGISDLDTLSQMSLRMEKIYDGYAFRRLHRPPVCSGTDASLRTTQKHNAAAVCSIERPVAHAFETRDVCLYAELHDAVLQDRNSTRFLVPI